MLGFEKRPSPLLELVGGKKQVFETFSPNSESSQSLLRRDFFLTKDLPRQYV
jgi:hypothetical protein